LHEAGHAVAAALLGWRVGRVVIGMGRPLGRFHIGRTLVEIRLFPVEGFVQPAPTNLRYPRLKSALIYLAGPGAELLLLAVVALAIGPDRLTTRTEEVGMLVAQSLAVAILFSAFVNLVPHTAAGQGGQMVANDGLGIIQSLFRPESDFAEQIHQRFDVPEDNWEETTE
jgi:hypothetical protein